MIPRKKHFTYKHCLYSIITLISLVNYANLLKNYDLLCKKKNFLIEKSHVLIDI